MRPTPCTGYETQARDEGHYFHGIRDTKARNARHKSTGCETQMHGIRDTHNGIRGTEFTGYGAQEKLLKWSGALVQYGFQNSEKIS